MPHDSTDRRLGAGGTDVWAPDERRSRRHMVADDVERHKREAERREDETWRQVTSAADWERFRDARIDAMRRSFGAFPPPPHSLALEATGEIEGDRFRVRKLLYETRPGVLVAAHLYLPDPPRERMPGIQIAHSHHRPKHQAELQDMGVNWARTGTAVLVPDLLGHGERREDPFGGRQGYYARYFTAMQLELLGENLMGWMVWDLLRGIDVLLGLPGIDRGRILMMGAVAGGGDPAAVAVALDPRITGSIPFNFGGGRHGNLAGRAYWEISRNPPLSARDGFFPWVIVAAAAPRPLVFAREFSWDADADEGWQRIRAVYHLYDAADRLHSLHGEGRCAPGPGNTHCTNIGPLHRQRLYPALRRCFNIEPPEPEIEDRREEDELACLTDAARGRKRFLRDILWDTAREHLEAMRAEREPLDPKTQRDTFRRRWTELLGDSTPAQAPTAHVRDVQEMDGVRREKIVLEVEPSIDVPALLLVPTDAVELLPVVVGVAQQGKATFLRARASEVAELLARGAAVCLPDVRGTGETRPSDLRTLESAGVRLSVEDRMLGRVTLGLQLRDLRAVLRYLETRQELDPARFGLWGDSFAPLNPPDFEPPPFDPKRVDHPDDDRAPYGPALGEPMGALLALFAALYEGRVTAVLARRGLPGFVSLFASYFFYVPRDCIVPGALTVGDLCDVAATLAPRPLRLDAPINAWNQAAPPDELHEHFAVTRAAYAGHPDRLEVSADMGNAADWFGRALDLPHRAT
jgi:dienelactone hydrolase